MDVNAGMYNIGTSYDAARTTAYKTGAEDKVQDAKDKENGKGNTINNPVKDNSDRVEFSKETRVTTQMSEKDRAQLIQSLKADQENQMNRFMNMMTGIFQKQGITGLTAGSDAFWQTISSGNFTVDAQTKAEAQDAISEDGYWGVKQTSQRLFDFAKALAGDDVDKMRQMQDAMYKGFEAAEKSWGKSLPGISYQTRDAADALFDEYYANASSSSKTAAAANRGATSTMATA